MHATEPSVKWTTISKECHRFLHPYFPCYVFDSFFSARPNENRYKSLRIRVIKHTSKLVFTHLSLLLFSLSLNFDERQEPI